MPPGIGLRLAVDHAAASQCSDDDVRQIRNQAPVVVGPLASAGLVLNVIARNRLSAVGALDDELDEEINDFVLGDVG